MSDYRNSGFDFRSLEHPYRDNSRLDPKVRAPYAASGWIAAAVFLVIVLAVAFGAGHKPGQHPTNIAANNMAPPPAAQIAPATTVVPPSATPVPAATAPPPITPAPNPPVQH